MRPWLAALVVYLVSRVVSTILLGTMFVVATANHWRFASHRVHATFFSFSGSWDASAYRTIAEHGYPTTLPLDAAGHVLPNPWAFLPVYPWVVHALTSLVGGNGTPNGFYTVGAVVSAVAGAVAAVLLSAILRRRIPPERALFAVVLFCVGPMGFLLQTAYAESLFLVLLFAALCCLVTRHYWLLIPFAVVAAFTRPGVLALALALGISFVVRLRERRMHGSPSPCATPSASWSAPPSPRPPDSRGRSSRPPSRDARERTSTPSSRSGSASWVGGTSRRSPRGSRWRPRISGPVLGVLAVVLVLALGVFWLTRRGTRILGPDIVGFTASYWLYLVAVFLPQQSLVRLMMPVAPMLGNPVFWGPASAGAAGSMRRRVLLVVGAVVLQRVAVVLLWFLGYP